MFEILSIILTIVAFYFWFKTYFKWDYYVLPSADLVNTINNDHKNSDKNGSKVDERDYKILIDLFISCIETNEPINCSREQMQLKMNIFMLDSLVAVMISYLLWIFCV